MKDLTVIEKGKDEVAKGRSTRGENNHSHKLTENQVRVVKAMRLGTKTYTEIAKEYGTTRQAISDIRRGKTWKWLK